MKKFACSTIILSLTAIFLLGAATGAVTALGLAKAKAEGKIEMENLEESIMAWAKDKLTLTPDQSVRIRPLVDLACNEYRAEQKLTLQRVIAIIRASNQRISTELTPSQIETLRESERKHEEYLKRKFKVEPPARL